MLKSLFNEVTITQIIADEFGKETPDFITIEDPKDKNYQKILESFLDTGESSAIALALEKEKCMLILDDFKGRREAKHLSLDYTGTIGILIIAKEKGLINSFTEIINEIKKTNFRISDELLARAKKKCGE